MPYDATVKPKIEPDFEAVFNSLPTPLLLMDRDFNIAALNQAFLDSTKLLREELVGRNIFAAFPAGQESRRILQESFERTRDQGLVDVVPLVSYAHIVNGRTEERLWSCTHVPVRDKSGRVAFLLKNAQAISEYSPSLKEGLELCPSLKEALTSEASSAARMRKGNEGAGGVEVLNQTLMATVRHLRSLVMQAPSFMCVLRGPDLVFELVNTAFSMLAGGRDLIGKTLQEGLPEFAGQDFPCILENVYRTGEVHVGRETRLLLQDAPDCELEEHYIDCVVQPITGPNGEVTGIFIEGSDVTDHIRTQERQALLIRELHHRVRNMLATVQGVLTASAITATNFAEFQQAFSNRIAALANTHALMTEQLDPSVSFQQLLVQELGPYSDEHGLRIRLSGPPVDLPSQIAVTVAMALHELTTNAVKHGALASEEGSIEVGWSLRERNGARALLCEWRESTGSPVGPPGHAGFGSTMLNRVLAQHLGADVDVDFAPEGLRLRMTIPLQAGH